MHHIVYLRIPGILPSLLLAPRLLLHVAERCASLARSSARKDCHLPPIFCSRAARRRAPRRESESLAWTTSIHTTTTPPTETRIDQLDDGPWIVVDTIDWTRHRRKTLGNCLRCNISGLPRWSYREVRTSPCLEGTILHPSFLNPRRCPSSIPCSIHPIQRSQANDHLTVVPCLALANTPASTSSLHQASKTADGLTNVLGEQSPKLPTPHQRKNPRRRAARIMILYFIHDSLFPLPPSTFYPRQLPPSVGSLTDHHRSPATFPSRLPTRSDDSVSFCFPLSDERSRSSPVHWNERRPVPSLHITATAQHRDNPSLMDRHLRRLVPPAGA